MSKILYDGGSGQKWFEMVRFASTRKKTKKKTNVISVENHSQRQEKRKQFKENYQNHSFKNNTSDDILCQWQVSMLLASVSGGYSNIIYDVFKLSIEFILKTLELIWCACIHFQSSFTALLLSNTLWSIRCSAFLEYIKWLCSLFGYYKSEKQKTFLIITQ